MICPKCNYEVPDGSLFCNHCGNKFEQENTIKCPNPECGHLIPADSKFCPDCGSKILSDESLEVDETLYYQPFFGDNKKVGYKDKRTGKVVIEPKFDLAFSFSCGVAIGVTNMDDFESRIIIINNDGSYISTEIRADFVDGFDTAFDDFVYRGEDSDYNELSIDTEGHSITEIETAENSYCPDFDYEEIREPSEGLAAICKDGKWGYINMNEELVVPMIYDNAFPFNSGYAIIALPNGKWNAIDKFGNPFFDYEQVWVICNGMAVVEINGKIGIVNLNNQVLIPIRYEYVGPIADGNFIFKKDGLWGIMDINERWIISPQFTEINLASGDTKTPVFAAKKYGKWGLVATNGQFISHFVYDDIESDGDFFRVLIDVKWGLLDVNGGMVANTIYDSISWFDNGLAKIELNGELGYIDVYGNTNLN